MIKKALLVAPAGQDIPDLLLGPGSVYNIRTNKDHSHTVLYSLLQGADVLAVDTGLFFTFVRRGIDGFKLGSTSFILWNLVCVFNRGVDFSPIVVFNEDLSLGLYMK